MKFDPLHQSRVLLESLLVSPLLVGELPEAGVFPRDGLALPDVIPELNFKQKLGHIYEDALAVLLESSREVELLERNLQIQVDRHNTVGELDYLLRDTYTGELVHLELAAKFYLAVKTQEGMTFPGPDARDHYGRKISRLLEHQLVLPQRYREYFSPEYQEVGMKTKQLVYGCLFDHVDSPQMAETDYLNPRCRRGRWLRINEAGDYFGDEILELIPKSLWPVPLELMEKFELERWHILQELERCVMVRITGNRQPHFIVPDRYPVKSR